MRVCGWASSGRAGQIRGFQKRGSMLASQYASRRPMSRQYTVELRLPCLKLYAKTRPESTIDGMIVLPKVVGCVAFGIFRELAHEGLLC